MQKKQAIITPLSFSLSVIAKYYMGALSKGLQDFEIERYHYTLLIIDENEGNITQQQLADLLHIDKTSIVRVLDYLVENKWIERKTNPLDRRQHYITTTAGGKKLAAVIKKEIVNLNQTALKGIKENEIEKFYETLDRIFCNLSKLPADNYFLNFTKIKK